MEQNKDNEEMLNLNDLDVVNGGTDPGDPETGNDGNTGNSDTTLPGITFKKKKN